MLRSWNLDNVDGFALMAPDFGNIETRYGGYQSYVEQNDVIFLASFCRALIQIAIALLSSKACRNRIT